MSMHKTMILPVCLGILLVGIIMTPSAFAIFPDPEEDPRALFSEILYRTILSSMV